MTSSNQKSLLSQVILDPAKIRESSSSALPPLHTGQSSFVLYRQKLSSKNNPRPLPFGSTSSRVIHQLQPRVSNHMVSYEPDRPIDDKAYECRKSPFGSTENRFRQANSYSPGPALYHSQNIKFIQKSSSSCIFSKVEKNPIEKQNAVGPGSYDVQPVNQTHFRQKIAQKYREHKRKYIQNLIRSSKKHQEEVKPINNSIHQPLAQEQQNKENKGGQQKMKNINPINRFVLKDHTKKYMMSGQKENHHYARETEPSCQIYNNFTYNFIEKYDDAYSSYLPKQISMPGPGYYPQRPTKVNHPTNQSSIFKSSSVRNVFPVVKCEGKRAKTKLSELL